LYFIQRYAWENKKAMPLVVIYVVNQISSRLLIIKSR
jgi:hypothetical protein